MASLRISRIACWIARLREVAREHAVPVGADHAGLEAHRERELGDHHRQERHHEDHGEQGEAALVVRQPARAHGEVGDAALLVR